MLPGCRPCRRSVALSPAVHLRQGVEVLRGRRKIFYGWWLMVGSLVAVGISTGISIWSFTLFVEPVEDEFGWTRAQVSLGISVAALAGGLASPFIGKWTDVQGPRRVILIGALLFAGSLALLGTTRELWQWYFYQALNGIGLVMTFFIPFAALASRWFVRKRGTAVGLLAVGVSLGGLSMVLILRAVINAIDWDGAFFFCAILSLVYFVPFAWLLVRNSPADVGAAVDGDAVALGGPRRPTRLPGVSLSLAMRTRIFWVLALAIGLFFFAAFGWTVHAAPFYKAHGIGKELAAVLVAITAGSGMLTRYTQGRLADHVRVFEKLAMGMAATGLLAMVALRLDPGAIGITIFLILWVWSNAGPSMLEPLALTRAFGVAHFATILGVASLLRVFLQLIGPVAAGAIYDETGSYDWALVMFIVIFGLSLALFAVAARLPRPALTPAAVAPVAVLPAPGG